MTEQSDPREVGRLIALRQLETRPRTERELHDTLCARGIPSDIADELIVRFVEVGLLDDRAYARLWIESRIRTRGLGVASLRRELRSRKVPDQIIDEMLSQVDPEDTMSAAVDQVRGRVARCQLPLDVKDERRLVSFLMRRGHGLDAARQAIAAAVEEVTSADEAG
ncbi:MAG: regulatory protein RecX [Candidatus Nanopelagicales bacterium]|nr:regulatory protein RecX [Actinomycetota bacterium]HNL50998.1 regulatory protein RecX [Actinomycetota bacterium]HNO14570.1 regulatory protein RecX [Actinomycetota bacterium]HUM85684.1 regulatory protein RecX [Actinomycetota bacterium]